MKLYTIWYEDHYGICLHDAWDENTIDVNPEGYQEVIEKAHKTFKGRVRELVVEIPGGVVDALFSTVSVKGKVSR